MSSVLVCSVSFDVSTGIPVCPAPGVLSSIDLSIFVGVSSTVVDPILAIQAFGAGLIIAGIPLSLVQIARIVISPLFKRYHNES